MLAGDTRVFMSRHCRRRHADKTASPHKHPTMEPFSRFQILMIFLVGCQLGQQVEADPQGCCAGPVSGRGFGSFFPPGLLLQKDQHIAGWDFQFYSDDHGNFAGRSPDGNIASVLLNTSDDWYVWLDGPGSCKRLGGYSQPYNNLCTGSNGYFKYLKNTINVTLGGKTQQIQQWAPAPESQHYLMFDGVSCLPVSEIGLGGVLGSGVQYHDIVKGPPPSSAFQVPSSCPKH